MKNLAEAAASLILFYADRLKKCIAKPSFKAAPG